MSAEPQINTRMSVFDGSNELRLRLVRTIAALANTAGGTIHIERVEGDGLESARLAETVNRHVSPRLRGIESSREADGSVRIHVAESDAKPHVFTGRGPDAGPAVFHAGQIWVRRNGEEHAAGGEEVQQMVREAASQLLERLSIGLRDPSFSLRLTDSAGIAVHLAEDEEAVPVSPNLARLYPYTTKTLARRLGKPTNWVATAAKVLRLKDSRENAYGVPAPDGTRVVQWRYSEHARSVLTERLDADRDWNPYHVL